MTLSVIMPARNEQSLVCRTVRRLRHVLQRAHIAHEILVIDDYSTDHTAARVRAFAGRHSTVRLVRNALTPGVGRAIQCGLQHATGDAMVIVMADDSDAPEDVVQYYRALAGGVDCAFGSRFMRGARVVGYPWHKWLLNRLANRCIQLLFWLPYNDVTNAFKGYRRHVIDGIQPILSHQFNITVELPLKAIVRGYSYTVLPTSWTQRRRGVSKLRIREMGSRYLFIVLYVWLERLLSRGDYRRSDACVS